MRDWCGSCTDLGCEECPCYTCIHPCDEQRVKSVQDLPDEVRAALRCGDWDGAMEACTCSGEQAFVDAVLRPPC